MTTTCHDAVNRCASSVYLTSSVVSIEGTDSRDFATIQGQNIDTFRDNHPDPENARVSQGLVGIPTDSATNDRVRRYREYAAILFAHAGFQRADEIAFALPFTFAPEDCTQIIGDMAGRLGPALGWTPTV